MIDERRVVRWDGAHNVRDLGGLRIRSGGRVAGGRVFRADYPGLALAGRPDVAQALGLVRAVDLRRTAELEAETPDWSQHGVEHVQVPLSAGRRSSWHASYERYLEHDPATVVAAVRSVMDVEHHPVLFHCAAGKDRTGVIAVLVLAAIGVEDDDIVADYVATRPAVEPVLERLGGIAVYERMLASTTTDEQMPRDAFARDLLRWLAERGGASAWLLSRGLPPLVLERFRAAMVERNTPLP